MTAKTYPIHCDELMLSMIAFSVEAMIDFLREDIKAGGHCGCGEVSRSVAQLKRDVKAGKRIVAQAIRGQVQLEKPKRPQRKKASKR